MGSNKEGSDLVFVTSTGQKMKNLSSESEKLTEVFGKKFKVSMRTYTLTHSTYVCTLFINLDTQLIFSIFTPGNTDNEQEEISTVVGKRGREEDE